MKRVTLTDYEKAQLIVEECERRGISLCEKYDDWTKIGLALGTLGEKGRELYKRLSRISDKYEERENDKKFTNTSRTVSKITIGTFFHYAKKRMDLNELFGKYSSGRSPAPLMPRRKPPEPPLSYLPIEYATLPSDGEKWRRNFLARYLLSLFSDEVVRAAFTLYHVGSMRDGSTIFPQIDTNGRLRTGKIIKYGTDGHRIKDKSKMNYDFWLHKIYLKETFCKGCGEREGSRDYCHKFSCCGKVTGAKYPSYMFGLHLLSERPNATVCLVEAEKTAVVCSIFLPEYIWVATGGKGFLTKDRVHALAGRKVLVYPDEDAILSWTETVRKFRFADWTVMDWTMGKNGKRRVPENSKMDLADLLLKEREEEVRQQGTVEIIDDTPPPPEVRQSPAPLQTAEAASVPPEAEAGSTDKPRVHLAGSMVANPAVRSPWDSLLDRAPTYEEMLIDPRIMGTELEPGWDILAPNPDPCPF